MLISLLAMFVMTVSSGIRALLAQGSVVLEGPSTLELALIGAGIILAYAVATRTMGRRRARTASTVGGTQLTAAASPVASVEEAAEQTPSRGAA